MVAGSRKLAKRAEHNHRAGDRDDLGDRHPVQPVHEVDQIHKPEARQQQQAAFDPERAGRNDPEIVGRGEDDRADGQGLQQQSRQHRDGFDVVGEADDGDEQRRSENRDRDMSARSCRRRPSTAPATSSVAAITAMPAPCGVGMRCDDRALGVASACRNSSGRIAQVMRGRKHRCGEHGEKRQERFGNGHATNAAVTCETRLLDVTRALRSAPRPGRPSRR